MAKIKVAIDAGHGSNTAGKKTVDGYREHWINVKVAYYCEQFLKKYGVDVFRCAWNDTNAKDDTDVPLSTRQKQIKNAKCDIALSMHANAHGSGSSWTSAKGVETLVHETASRRGDSTKLATCIQKQLVKGTKQTDRGVKQMSLAMCNCSAMGVKAAALMEIGFMTNEYEADLMKTDAFCKEQGEEIAKGVLDYFKIDYTTKKEIVILAGAMEDENRNLKNGKAGDQLQKSSTNDTKGEVRFKEFYIHKKGWYGFRFISDAHADKFIEAVKQIVNNKNIGYDQNNRYDIIEKLKKYGTLEKISVPTECVCSSLIRAAIIQATGKDLGPFLSGDMPELFDKSGLFEKKIVVKSDSDVEDGMILVTKTKGHTEAVVSGKPRKKKSATASKTFKPYLVKITAKSLNVRKGAGQKYKVVTKVKKDEVYTIVDVKMNGKTKWGLLKSGKENRDMWISLKYTKKV